MISVAGAFLENYLYLKLDESGLFDDIKMSAVIDFSDDKYAYPVRCEIDCLIIKDNRLLFVSCKSSKADATTLNEIYVHNHRFGNALSLCATWQAKTCAPRTPGPLNETVSPSTSVWPCHFALTSVSSHV